MDSVMLHRPLVPIHRSLARRHLDFIKLLPSNSNTDDKVTLGGDWVRCGNKLARVGIGGRNDGEMEHRLTISKTTIIASVSLREWMCRAHPLHSAEWGPELRLRFNLAIQELRISRRIHCWDLVHISGSRSLWTLQYRVWQWVL